jgi:hypothetical protein
VILGACLRKPLDGIVDPRSGLPLLDSHFMLVNTCNGGVLAECFVYFLVMPVRRSLGTIWAQRILRILQMPDFK